MSTPTRTLLAALPLLAWGCGADGPSITAPAFSHTTDAQCANDAAPAISGLRATPNVLWPPNHKMVTVQVRYVVSDANLTGVSLRIESDEPVNGRGDGNTAPDWTIGSVTSTGATVQLRAERSGLGDGRVYTVTVVATDACGHTTEGSVNVFVPHDRRRR